MQQLDYPSSSAKIPILRAGRRGQQCEGEHVERVGITWRKKHLRGFSWKLRGAIQLDVDVLMPNLHNSGYDNAWLHCGLRSWFGGLANCED